VVHARNDADAHFSLKPLQKFIVNSDNKAFHIALLLFIIFQAIYCNDFLTDQSITVLRLKCSKMNVFSQQC